MNHSELGSHSFNKYDHNESSSQKFQVFVFKFSTNCFLIALITLIIILLILNIVNQLQVHSDSSTPYIAQHIILSILFEQFASG